MKLHDFRKQYIKKELDDANLPQGPIALFEQWMETAIENHAFEANVMVLSTVHKQRPSARVVLLKEVDEKGFVFFTNYDSRKGTEISESPFGSLTFYWADLERQVRVEGILHRIASARSDEYFNSRPKLSRISAIVSPQSQVIDSRELLETKLKAIEQSGSEIIRPENWGGYCLVPDAIEFWQGRVNRMHDRIRYRLDTGHWVKERLAP